MSSQALLVLEKSAAEASHREGEADRRISELSKALATAQDLLESHATEAAEASGRADDSESRAGELREALALSQDALKDANSRAMVLQASMDGITDELLEANAAAAAARFHTESLTRGLRKDLKNRVEEIKAEQGRCRDQKRRSAQLQKDLWDLLQARDTELQPIKNELAVQQGCCREATRRSTQLQTRIDGMWLGVHQLVGVCIVEAALFYSFSLALEMDRTSLADFLTSVIYASLFGVHVLVGVNAIHFVYFYA